MMTVVSGRLCAPRLRVLYEATVLSVILYCVEAYWPTAEVDDRRTLRRMHARGCRLITGCIGTANTDAVLAEAGFPTLDEIVALKLLEQFELLRRVDPALPVASFGPRWVADLANMRCYKAGAIVADLFPTKQAATRPVQGLDQQFHIRDAARETNVAGHAAMPIPWQLPYAPDQTDGYRRVFFVPAAPDGLAKDCSDDCPCRRVSRAPSARASPSRDSAEEEDPHKALLRGANERRVTAELLRRPDYVVLCDGSVKPPSGRRVTARAAGAALIFRGVDLADVPVATPRVPAGTLACSFTAEMWALCHALEWLANPRNLPDGSAVLVVTDSQSSLHQLERGPLLQRTHLATQCWLHLLALGNRGCTVRLTFIFSHCDYPPGDRIDDAATAACDAVGAQRQMAWSLDAVRERAKILAAKLAEASRNAAVVGRAATCSKRAARRGVPLVPTKRRVGAGGEAPLLRSFWQTNHVLSGGGRWPRYWFSATWSRRSERLLYQLRTGACPELGGIYHEAPEDCPHCKDVGVLRRGAGGAVDHLFQCRDMADVRDRWGVQGVRDLWENPGTAIGYFHEWLGESPPPPPPPPPPRPAAATPTAVPRPRPVLPAARMRAARPPPPSYACTMRARRRGEAERPPPPPYTVVRPPPPYHAQRRVSLPAAQPEGEDLVSSLLACFQL
jgi:ribonuclease HI